MKIKSQREILEKLQIRNLNAMQLEAQKAIRANGSTILLSPTGTGKTLAFLLPIIEGLDNDCAEVQTLILVPSRELAIQIEQVIREMGSGYKANAVYGGRAFSKDKLELNHLPAMLIGTPGRVADHLRRESFSVDKVRTLVLDEFDKSLEVGFESEMIEIIESLPKLEKKILTSATQGVEIPEFAGIENPIELNYLDQGKTQLEIRTLLSPTKDKLSTLVDLLQFLENKTGIIFCNFKDSIQEVSDFLDSQRIGHGCFYGGMEQKDRERALIKFRNGTHSFLIATDLAARGLDIPELDFIIHYQLPLKKEEFTHRNGRTARMNEEGTAYVLQWEKEELPDFIPSESYWEDFRKSAKPSAAEASKWSTLFVSGGRKDKISKGDLAGLFLKQGGLGKEELGVMELKQDCAFVAVPASKAKQLIGKLNNSRLKKKKVRITLI